MQSLYHHNLAVEEGEPVYLEGGMYLGPMALYVDPHNFGRERSEFCVTLKNSTASSHYSAALQNKSPTATRQIPALIVYCPFS